MARITVVNDYPEFLETMYAILDGAHGHAVAGFNGDETTVEQLADSNPELMIVDLRLAGEDMKGWDILTLARSHPALREIPLIVCSADVRTLRERADEFKRFGNILTLEKPFDVDDVIRLVEEALGS